MRVWSPTVRPSNGDASLSHYRSHTKCIAKMSAPHSPNISSRISLEDQTLWWGRIEWTNDALVVSGWRWTGPFERRIPIDHIRLVERWSTTKGPNFAIHTPPNGALRCRIQGAWHWEKAFREDARVDVRLRH